MSWEATLLGSALDRLPRAVRERAERATLLRAAGYDEGEIAAVLDVNRRTLHRDRQALRQALVDALRQDGYTDPEIARELETDEAEIHVPNRSLKPTYEVTRSA